ncbi:hypothetical protein B9Z19DRAFT_1088554 [Tuber borchii]|uniref:Uncharacterized protein n=1 Tax=Tuber borchii TaxID=42251 RepID=A0A2T6ZLB6_TUBBO|nr:hypothetical protein B9Z19DRAFT_1088554 [Tuber borchii]
MIPTYPTYHPYRTIQYHKHHTPNPPIRHPSIHPSVRPPIHYTSKHHHLQSKLPRTGPSNCFPSSLFLSPCRTCFLSYFILFYFPPFPSPSSSPQKSRVSKWYNNLYHEVYERV